MTDTTRPPAGFKDLCIDALDARAAGEFWAEVLGLRLEDRHGNVLLTGAEPEHAIWINAVSEPRTVKQRVHLDVHTGAIADLVAAGATVVGASHSWTDLTDPEGGEFCGFVRPTEKLPDYRVYELVVDSVEPRRIGGWWSEVLGLELEAGDDEAGPWASVGPGAGLPWEVVFGAVPEPKTVKNRNNWDLWGSTGELLAAGATLLRARDDEISWDVLADPEGNEFCVFARRE
jgi:catechol 2,3-dioxygenase-like lactoylglutathione lyase family enzyme